MHNRRERVLKFSCLALAAVLAFQLVRFILVGDPAKGLVIPPLPSLPPELEAQTTKTTNAPAAKGTNAAGIQASAKSGASTNSSKVGGQTNSVVAVDAKKVGSEATSSSKSAETNSASAKETSPIGSNSALGAISSKQGDSNQTNSSANTQPGVKLTNIVAPITAAGNPTNTTNIVSGPKTGTNAVALNASGKTNASPPARMAMAGMPGMGGKPPELPAAIKERVDRITQGEILGQVMRPMPMALLGIAGPNAFLRSPDGQTGMIKEGEKLGNLKLLRIGNNRVLVEEEGEKKELSIFAGLGSETLMPAKEPSSKEKKPNEPTNAPPSKTN